MAGGPWRVVGEGLDASRGFGLGLPDAQALADRREPVGMIERPDGVL